MICFGRVNKQQKLIFRVLVKYYVKYKFEFWIIKIINYRCIYFGVINIINRKNLDLMFYVKYEYNN